MLLARHSFPFVLPLVAGLAPAQGDCVDQSYIPNPATNGLEVTSNQPVTQTFTVGRSGQLTRVEISLINHHRGTPTQPLRVDIVTTDSNGVPTATSLASVTLQPGSVPARRGAVQIDLRSFNVQVQNGQVLGLALASNAAPSGQTYGWWGEAPGGSYPGGEIFIRQTTRLSVWDLAFRTWVSAPASSSNYGTGHAGTNGVPSLTSSAAPLIGTSPSIQIGNALGTATAGALFSGFVQSNQATPFGGSLLVQILANVSLTVPPGGAQLATPIPNDPVLCGLSVSFQAVHADPGASHGIAFSRGLELVIGG